MTSRIDKLNMLKEIIEYIPFEKIDLGVWRFTDLDVWKLSSTISSSNYNNYLTGYNTLELLSKNVYACLIGWATSDIKFQKLGFNFHNSFGPIYSKDLIMVRDDLIKCKLHDSDIPFISGWKAIITASDVILID